MYSKILWIFRFTVVDVTSLTLKEAFIYFRLIFRFIKELQSVMVVLNKKKMEEEADQLVLVAFPYDLIESALPNQFILQ